MQPPPDSGTHDTTNPLSMCAPNSTFYASQFMRTVWRKILMFENWRERKWRNKGTNKHQPDSGKHDKFAHYPHVYQVSIF